MAHKKKKLGNFIANRRQKYKRPLRILFHMSIAPRNVLIPHRTTWNPLCFDPDRSQSALFLSPFNQLRHWCDWVTSKFHGSTGSEMMKRLFQKGFVVIYVHIVRIDPNDLEIPENRFMNEFFIKKAIKPLKIVPIRYYLDKRVDLGKVCSAVREIKHWKY